MSFSLSKQRICCFIHQKLILFIFLFQTLFQIYFPKVMKPKYQGHLRKESLVRNKLQANQTAATAERNKIMSLTSAHQNRNILTTAAQRDSPVQSKQGTATRSKVMESRNETGASTGQDQTHSKGISPSTSVNVSSFQSPDVRSKKLMLKEALKTGRMTITAGKKNRTEMENTVELTGLQAGQSVNRINIIRPIFAKETETNFERACSPMEATMVSELQKRIQTSVPSKKRGSMNMVESAPEGDTVFKRTFLGNCNQSQAKAPLKTFMPLSPGSQKNAFNDSQSYKPSNQDGKPISSIVEQSMQSSAQKKKPIIKIKSKDDYSGQLMALGKGADTVLIKDMIKRTNNDASGSESEVAVNAADSRHSSPLSTRKRQRSNHTSNGKRRRYISTVTPYKPEQSPPLGYSNAVRCSSNPREFDPEVIIDALQRNKVFHKDFNQAMITKQWRNQFREIIDAAIPADDPRYVDVYNKYAERPPSVIDKLKAEQDKKLKELVEKFGSKDNEGNLGVIKTLDRLMGNVSEQSEIQKPQNVVRRSKMIKWLMYEP